MVPMSTQARALKIEFSGVRKVVRQEEVDKPQAGAIIIRGNGDDRRFLLVTNKGGDRWLFPKGTVKKKEYSEEAAEREAEEESGVRGRVIAYVGATESDEEGESIRVDYFLLAYRGEVDVDEARERKWCKSDELVSWIDTPEICALLEVALPEIEQFDIDTD
jgi:8-oxo-dGTP pyrophosphatase MutT (NUDIX family)